MSRQTTSSYTDVPSFISSTCSSFEGQRQVGGVGRGSILICREGVTNFQHKHWSSGWGCASKDLNLRRHSSRRQRTRWSFGDTGSQSNCMRWRCLLLHASGATWLSLGIMLGCLPFLPDVPVVFSLCLFLWSAAPEWLWEVAEAWWPPGPGLWTTSSPSPGAPGTAGR